MSAVFTADKGKTDLSAISANLSYNCYFKYNSIFFRKRSYFQKGDRNNKMTGSLQLRQKSLVMTENYYKLLRKQC